MASVSENVVKFESSCIARENVKWSSHFRKVCQFLNKLNIELPYDSAIPLLGIYPRDIKQYIHKNLYLAACFIGTKKWKQAKFQSTGEKKSTMWPMHAMGCYSPWKDDALVCARAWVNLENSLPRGRSQTQKAMWYMIPLIWSVQKTQIPRNIKEISGRQELGWDGNREWLLMGTRFPFDLMKMSWDYVAWWLLWEEARESVWLPVDLGELHPGNWSLLTTFPVLGVFILPTVPTVRAFSRTRSWESHVLLKSPGEYMWLNPASAPAINKILWAITEIYQRSGRGLCLVTCHLNWVACLFLWSVLVLHVPMHGGQFMNQQLHTL